MLVTVLTQNSETKCPICFVRPVGAGCPKLHILQDGWCVENRGMVRGAKRVEDGDRQELKQNFLGVLLDNYS